MIKLHNTLTRKIEEFKPIIEGKVGMYTCGPTVYHFATIGNYRTYTTSDILLRTLEANGYSVKFIMNLTDVGHLTGDNLGDADTGEDRMEKAAKRESKTVWDIAEFYITEFKKDFSKLNLKNPKIFCRATEHILEQVDLVKKIEQKGLSYKTSDGLYFDTKKFEDDTGKKYGELSTLDEIKEGARVEINPEKKNPRDFALWKFSEKVGDREMEWKSPWGVGFPGWHLECSAMAMKYLGENFDIHVGGMDLRSTHHPNEIAQSEAVTDKKFVNYWLHGEFILIDGKRMGKSAGNAYIISDIEKRGFEPLALRYLYLTGHYREILNFTWESLQAAQNALNNMRQTVRAWNVIPIGVEGSLDVARDDNYYEQFMEALNEDLNTSKALAVLWNFIKSDLDTSTKSAILLEMDKILGLQLDQYIGKQLEIPEEVQKLVDQREEVRLNKDFAKSDKLRDEIKKLGYEVLDTPEGQKLRKI